MRSSLRSCLVILGAALVLGGTLGPSTAQGQGGFSGGGFSGGGFSQGGFGGSGFRGGDRGGGPGRRQMEACTNRVLAGLVRVRAPEEQAGARVVARCNGPLRAAVADAIRTGEAFICSNVDACMPMAQERAASQARDLYRRMMQR